MGGGVAMRAAAKVAGIGILNGSLRGGENPVVSAARSVASVVSSSASDDLKLSIARDDRYANSSVEKAYDDDWELAGVEDELFMEAGEPMPRLVFGGAPSIQEAKQATSDLNYALEKTYLLPNATNGQGLSDSESVETKPCLVSETLVAPLPSKHAIQAFRLLNENPKAQNVVASIASDPNVWNAVLQNPDLVDFLQTHKTEVVFPEMDSTVNDTSDETPEATNESKSASGKGFMDYVEEIKQKITVTVVDMMNSLSDTFQTLFGGSSPKDGVTVNPDGTAGISMEQTAIGATLMGLAIMVISVVVLKRS
ncbi:hypothetical protein L1987_19605 [Smallanthus sonchifolius]|uniref:Uncharacterized protein n=1 Tax=Smallanthus sonchifolius TaxID=185202 RepID=A0ACB9IPR9_9ASTR|nr:hypothetical protein L1987_19605 [Smallanthus sonchifolius]